MTRYLRNDPTRAEDATAALVSGALALGVGVVTFYLVRLLLAREPVERISDAAQTDIVRAEG